MHSLHSARGECKGNETHQQFITILHYGTTFVVDLVEISENKDLTGEIKISITESVSEQIAEKTETRPLMFTKLLEDRHTVVGETVEFSCQMTQSGIEATWSKDNEPLSLTEGKYKIINKDCSYQLIIPSVTVKDMGEYTITAKDLQSTATLTVHG